jgi:hypothetical protein
LRLSGLEAIRRHGLLSRVGLGAAITNRYPTSFPEARR